MANIRHNLGQVEGAGTQLVSFDVTGTIPAAVSRISSPLFFTSDITISSVGGPGRYDITIANFKGPLGFASVFPALHVASGAGSVGGVICVTSTAGYAPGSDSCTFGIGINSLAVGVNGNFSVLVLAY